MTVAAIPQISFTAQWNTSNKSLKNTLWEKISRVAFYSLHSLAMSLALPSIKLPKTTALEGQRDFDERWKDVFHLKRIELVTPDGVKIRGTFMQRKDCEENAPVVIFAQPNQALAHGSEGITAFNGIINYSVIEEKKCNFLVFDYRGVGTSEGSPTLAKDLIIDGESVYQFAKDSLKVDPQNIHMMGYSFGGGVTAQVKALHPESTGNYVNDRSFTSIIDTTYILFGKGIIAKIACGLLRLLGWNALNSASALEKIKSRTLLAYHPKDEVIRNEAQLSASPQTRAPNIKKLELTANLPEDSHHSYPLQYMLTQSGRTAAEEVGEFLLADVESTPTIWEERLAVLPTLDKNVQNKIYGYVARLFQNGGYHGTSGEDAFLGRNGLSLTTGQKIEAIRAAMFQRASAAA